MSKLVSTMSLPYRGPAIRVYSARELADMPLTKMQAALSEQEAFARGMERLSPTAASILRSLKGGAVVTVKARKARSGKLNPSFYIGEKRVRASVIRALARRGFLELPAQFEQTAR